MRIDKFIWCVRLTKTRALAVEIISKGKLKLNEQVTKPSKEIVVGDQISFHKHNAVFQYRILSLPKSRLSSKLVEEHIEDFTAVEEVEKYSLYQKTQSSYRQHNGGKPSSKDRRKLDEFKNNGF